MYLDEKPGQHSRQAVMVTWLWMSHRSDTRISIKPSFKTIFSPLNLQCDLVLGNGVRLTSLISLQRYTASILAKQPFPHCLWGLHSVPWPASLPRLTKAGWKVTLVMCTTCLPGPPHSCGMPSSEAQPSHQCSGGKGLPRPIFFPFQSFLWGL